MLMHMSDIHDPTQSNELQPHSPAGATSLQGGAAEPEKEVDLQTPQVAWQNLPSVIHCSLQLPQDLRWAQV